jgi:GAF domain-containing protein
MRKASSTMSDDPQILENALRTLSRLVLAEETLEETHGRVASLACRTLPPCDLASLTMVTAGRPSTPVQTDPAAAALDSVQYRSRRGPCLEAYEAGKIVRERIPEQAARWPEFSDVAQKVGVKSVLAVPLVINDQSLGALNLYSKSPAGYDGAAEETALLFSQQAAVACANAEVYWRTFMLTEHLREALESRDVIGQAKGVLMARRNCTAEAAFDMLRRASQHRNIKLREIADQVVYLGDLED